MGLLLTTLSDSPEMGRLPSGELRGRATQLSPADFRQLGSHEWFVPARARDTNPVFAAVWRGESGVGSEEKPKPVPFAKIAKGYGTPRLPRR